MKSIQNINIKGKSKYTEFRLFGKTGINSDSLKFCRNVHSNRT